MTTAPLTELCAAAVGTATKLGADDAEAFGRAVRSISTTIEKGDLQTTKTRNETSIAIRVFVGGRAGFASTNDPESLRHTCMEAIALAKAAPVDANNILPPPRTLRSVRGTDDPQARLFTTEDAIARTVGILEAASVCDPRVVIGDAEFTADLTERALWNTNGVRAHERGSLFAWSVLGTARDGDRVSAMDFQYGASRSVDGIDVTPAVRRVCEVTVDSLGASPCTSFRGAALLSPHAVESILVSLILFQINARNVLRGLSRWKRERESEIAAPALSIVDDGTLPGGVASSAFDREGQPHSPCAIIEQGRLQSFLHNAYSAHALGETNTCHAGGSAHSVPAITATNLAILPGPDRRETLIEETRKGILVTRFSGNVDPVSGDFSGVVKGGYLIKNGRIVQPVTGTLIAGNGFDALRSISGISQERESLFSYTLPTIRIEDVSVTSRAA